MAKGGKYVAARFSVEAALNEAVSEIESLAEEMRSWADGMEEKLSHTSKYEDVSTAAEVLENGDVSVAVEQLLLQIEEAEGAGYIKGKLRERGAIEEVMAELRADLKKREEQQIGTEDEGSLENESQALEEIRESCEELEGALDEIEGVEFPGMYG